MSFDHRERNGSRNDCVNKENLEKIHEHVLSPRRTGFIKTESICDRRICRSSRWTVAIACLFANRHLHLLAVGLIIDGQDLIGDQM